MKYMILSFLVSVVLAIVKIKKQKKWKKKVEKTLAEELSQCDNIISVNWNDER